MIRKIRLLNSPKSQIVVHSLLIMTWLGVLSATDSYFSVYALCGILSIYSFNYNISNKISGWDLGCAIFAFVLSSIIVLANYPLFHKIWYMDSLFYSTNLVKNGLNLLFCSFGGFAVFYHIILALSFVLPRSLTGQKCYIRPRSVFFIVFLSILLSIRESFCPFNKIDS